MFVGDFNGPLVTQWDILLRDYYVAGFSYMAVILKCDLKLRFYLILAFCFANMYSITAWPYIVTFSIAECIYFHSSIPVTSGLQENRRYIFPNCLLFQIYMIEKLNHFWTSKCIWMYSLLCQNILYRLYWNSKRTLKTFNFFFRMNLLEFKKNIEDTSLFL